MKSVAEIKAERVMDKRINAENIFEMVGSKEWSDEKKVLIIITGMKLNIQDYYYYGNPSWEEKSRCRNTHVYLYRDGALFRSKEDYELYGLLVEAHMDWMRFYGAFYNVSEHEDKLNYSINPGVSFNQGYPTFMFSELCDDMIEQERRASLEDSQIEYSKVDDGHGHKSFRKDKKNYYVINKKN